MKFELAYDIWMYVLLLVAIVSGASVVRNYNRKFMVALFVPAMLALITTWLLRQYFILGKMTVLVAVLSGIVIFNGLSIWIIFRSMTWGVARAQRYVKVESRYLVVNDELFPDPTQSVAHESDEHDGQHEVQGHWRYSASGTRHWVRAHTRSNPKGHSRSGTSDSSEPKLKEEVEITWEADGPPINTFVIGWRWFWQSTSETEFDLVREDTDFDFVIPITGHHFFRHKITRLSHIECPSCQRELVQWGCSCGMTEMFHIQDGQWYPHPPDHVG